MIEISQLSLLILGELLVGLTLLSGLLLGSLMTKKSKIRKAAQHLVERIQSDKAARIARLKKRLAEEYLYDGEKLEQRVHDLTQVEMRLYQNVINSYLKQDVMEFQQTDVDVENLVIAYQGLDLPSAGASSVSGNGGSGPDEEIEQLKQQNEKLSEELRVTMDTMGRMLNEYSSMFAGGADNDFDREEFNERFTSQRPQEGSVAADGISATDETEMPETEDDDLVDSLIQIDEDQSVLDAQESDSTAGEQSILDDMAEIDIEIPEINEEEDEPPPAPGSLEEEWARLLEEDADATGTGAGDMNSDADDEQRSA